MEQQKKIEQKSMKGKEEEDSCHSIAEKMALVELEENHLHRRLSLEMECEIFKCMKEEIQRKFIWGMGRGIYAMFRQKLLRKVFIIIIKKKIYNYPKILNLWPTFAYM
jgi:hypothetical protein